MANEILFETVNLSKHFGALAAVDDFVAGKLGV